MKKANNVEKREYKEKRKEWRSISDTKTQTEVCTNCTRLPGDLPQESKDEKQVEGHATSDIHGTNSVLITTEFHTDLHCAPAVETHKSTDLSHT